MLWDVDLNSWLRIAGRVANRNLTWAEWQEYFPDESVVAYRRTFRHLPWPADLPEADWQRAQLWEFKNPPRPRS